MGHDVPSQGHAAAAGCQHTGERAAFLIPTHSIFTYLRLRRDHEAALGNIQPHHHLLTLHLRLRNEPRHRLRSEP
jgi:hypothetical protein